MKSKEMMKLKEIPFEINEEVYVVIRECDVDKNSYTIPCDLCETTGKITTTTGKTISCPKCWGRGFEHNYDKTRKTLTIQKFRIKRIEINDAMLASVLTMNSPSLSRPARGGKCGAHTHAKLQSIPICSYLSQMGSVQGAWVLGGDSGCLQH